MSWLAKRKFRYKSPATVPFEQVKAEAKTGDIILFHKDTRNGLLETIEVDLLSPLVFAKTEFRHCGIIVRQGGEIHVMECADELHSGHSDAFYLTKGTGIRMVPIEALLDVSNPEVRYVPFRGKAYPAYFYHHGPYEVWGLTGRMLKAFLDLVWQAV